MTSSDGLWAALKAAHAGDTILLAAGDYGAISLNNFHFDGTVNIQSADSAHEAVLNSLTLNGVSGLAFSHLDVSVLKGGFGVTVSGSSHVSLSGLTVHGAGSVDIGGLGVYVRDSTGVSVTGSEITNLGSGIGHSNSHDVTISNNNLHNLQTDGIFGGGSSHVVVSGNHITEFHTLEGAHPDAIQFWGASNGAAGTDVTVSDNVITRGAGDAFQGVFIENTQHISVTGNAMDGTMWNGISLSTSGDAVVQDNFVQGFADMDARIVVRGQSSDVSVLHNSVQTLVNYQDGGHANPGYVASDNTIIGGTVSTDLSAMNSWLSLHTGLPVSPVDNGLSTPVVSPPPVDLTQGAIYNMVQDQIQAQIQAQIHVMANPNWFIV